MPDERPKTRNEFWEGHDKKVCDLREKTRLGVEMVGEKLPDAVNDMSFPYMTAAKEIVRMGHRTLQQNVMRLVFAIIQTYADAYHCGEYDPRNEAAVKAAAYLQVKIDEEREDPVGSVMFLPHV